MEVIPAYDRNVLVRCFTRQFETVARMGYMEDSNIQHAPPPGGWDDSQIDAKSLRIMGRNETVIDLLRHIPYLVHECEVLPETTPIKYLGRKSAQISLPRFSLARTERSIPALSQQPMPLTAITHPLQFDAILSPVGGSLGFHVLDAAADVFVLGTFVVVGRSLVLAT